MLLVKDSGQHGVIKGGRLASLAIEDWFSGHLADGFREWKCPELRDPSRQFSDAGSDHHLIVIQTQSYGTSDPVTGAAFHHISSMCKYCRYHFVFKITTASVNLDAEPMHHLICDSADYNGDVATKYEDPSVKAYPLEGKAAFSCTSCCAKVHIEISLPRLNTEWLNILADENRVAETLEKAKVEEPERFSNTSPEKETALIRGAMFSLNLYLKDVLSDDVLGTPRRISFRNKTFMVQFGSACEPIFRYLGFEDEYDHTRDERFWIPPRLPKHEGKTPLGSTRAFYEDVRSEVQSLLDQNPPANAPVVKPLSSPRDQIEEVLLPRNRNTVSGPNKPVLDSQLADLRTLGVSGYPSPSDELLMYAYRKQYEVDPENRGLYLDALGRLAENAGSPRGEDLQMFVFAERDSVSKATLDKTASQPGHAMASREKAYAHFGLRSDCPEAPEYFINVFNVYREQSPAQKHEHRKNLLQIGKDRNSSLIVAQAYETPMDVHEAYNLLEAGVNWPLDMVGVHAQSLQDGLDLELTIMALEVIYNDRFNDPERPVFESTLEEIRSRRNMPALIPPDNDATGNQDTVMMDLPPGLANLRNTCYLNSILQYFYSVRAIRDLVLGLERPPLEPTEEHLQSLLSGTDSAQLETGRAFVGHEFARELHTLFRELESSTETAVTPRQRLANAALLRPEMMRPQTQQAVSIPDPPPGDAPPLPPRAGEGTQTKVTVESVPEPSETASNVSSQTLVNQPDEDPSYVVVDMDASTAENGSYPAAPLDIETATGQEIPRPASTEPKEATPKQSKLSVEELAAELEKANIGSEQMDVDEVMGNAIDHLRAAFKVAHIDRPGAVPDPIEQAFFSTFIDHRKKAGDASWNRSTRTDRWVTAYPAKSGTRDIYEALGNSFNLEVLPGGLLSFTTIDRPAPNFHICIQRTDGVRKNSNPIGIRDQLFLDRFMESRHYEREMYQAKKRGSDLDTRLNELNELSENTNTDGSAQAASKQINFVTINPATDKAEILHEDIDEFIHAEYLEGSAQGDDEGWSILSPEIKDVFVRYDLEAETAETVSIGTTEQPETIPAKSRSEITTFWEKFVEEEDFQKRNLLDERANLFDKVNQEVEYRLHAVVCHAGSSAAAGHYWVWIHDFEQDVWRKYNDTSVSVHPADFVFQELTTKGEPYYLAYVRAQDIPHLVNIPRRQASTHHDNSIDPSLQSGESWLVEDPDPWQRTPSIKDTNMPDVDDKPTAEHFEEVEMSTAAN